MKKRWISALILFCSAIMLFSSIPVSAKGQEHCISQSEVNFKNEFRRLWMDHVLWTSNYITSATTAGSEDQKQVLARLLKNQEDIGDAIKPIYGDDAGSQLTALLVEHIKIAGKIVEAAKNKNEALVKRLNKEWYRNAEDIAAFLSSAIPNLTKDELKKLLYVHLELVADDLTASLSKDWEARIKAIDDGMTHIIMMADVISSGVVKQFPEKFTS